MLIGEHGVLQKNLVLLVEVQYMKENLLDFYMNDILKQRLYMKLFVNCFMTNMISKIPK